MVKYSKDLKINGNVRFVTDGESKIIPINSALNIANENGLDLVVLDTTKEYPVVKIMDYGKEVYDKHKRMKNNKKRKIVHLKEIRFHVNTDPHDVGIKVKQMRKFLTKGDRVKITIQYRGRECTHSELGKELIADIIDQLKDVSKVESAPVLQGRTLSALLTHK